MAVCAAKERKSPKRTNVSAGDAANSRDYGDYGAREGQTQSNTVRVREKTWESRTTPRLHIHTKDTRVLTKFSTSYISGLRGVIIYLVGFGEIALRETYLTLCVCVRGRERA